MLCYVFDRAGRLLLLHRRKDPNRDLYSPIGGKLEQPRGESPTACAVREIAEETGLRVEPGQLHLTGIISEAGYEGAGHWLMFLYEVTCPIALAGGHFDEGVLEWHRPQDVVRLPIPVTDRQIIWPLFWRYRGRFFAAHIDCEGPQLRYRLEQPASDAGPWLVGDQAPAASA